jgi:hypothetical protein
MRIHKPCREDLDAMPRAASGPGVHCTSCDRDVVDLRRASKKRALAVLEEIRRSGDGRVCARVRATPDGVPVFAKDPSPLARFAMPAVLAGSLAACAPSASSDRATTPIAMIPTEQSPLATNANTGTGTSTGTPVATSVVYGAGRTPVQQPGAYPEIVEMAGEMAYYGP